MNSMDLYEFSEAPAAVNATTTAGSSTSSGTTTVPQQSLEEEVTQVFGQLGRFWGGFRKQSATAFESAKKDLGQAVNQAREQVGKLAAPEPITEGSNAAASAGDPASVAEPSSPIQSSDKGKMREPTTPPRTSISDATTTTSTTPTQPSINSFFSRLQSSLPPQLAAESISQTFQTIQKQIQPTVSNASQAAAAQVDIKSIKTSLTSNFQRIQSNALVQEAEKLAEEYRIKSEAMLKEAGEYLKDAVKVVPPEEASGSGIPSGLTWDGSDMWMFPTPGWGGAADSSDAKGRPSGETLMPTRLTRAEAILARLRRDPEILKLNPAEDATVKERYAKYLEDEITVQGGLQGDVWSARIKAALDANDPEGVALQATYDNLVPSTASEDDFWHRYFFRIHQVQEEEEKRKVLLEATTQKEEDFSWEDDEEESPKAAEAALPAATTPTAAPAAGAAPTTEPSSTHEVSSTEEPPASPKSTRVLDRDGPATSSKTTLSPPKDSEAATESAGPSSTFASPRESEESYDLLSAGVHSKDASSDDSDWE
ncbi:hypothetical protein FRB95_007227 [Tulasnella sp. JGI-2019a]|nr:hypothetical protein FRB93_013671 [Tulasnella sp. JGI-2019a]KAG9039800.1 hypothetical protein FRB95_007227 [Tulasnella sp. JGI-2019a]